MQSLFDFGASRTGRTLRFFSWFDFVVEETDSESFELSAAPGLKSDCLSARFLIARSTQAPIVIP
ncbi:MAG: hypothetical protein CMM52_13685 [Rhodospirillaceae bacterium]|nr:hypothetical protein [Rhodospirillaceae bacterium]